MLIDERKHPQKLQWDDQGANTMTDKITIERETLQQVLDALDYLGDSSDRDVTPSAWVKAQGEKACGALRAALAAQPAEPLTMAQIAKAMAGAGLQPEDYREDGMIEPLVRAVERAHGIGRQAVTDDKTGDGLPPPDFTLDGGDSHCYYATTVRAAIAAAVARERERCAALCDRFAARGMHPAECAAAIRGGATSTPRA